MSKYDQYIKEFLLKNSELSVEKIGIFVPGASGGDEKLLHPQFITFKFNKKAQTSEELINFIVAETGKSKTLISSDLSSLFDDARQFANIGKPFSFAGLGTISLNRQGEYEFTPVTGNVSVADPGYSIKSTAEPVAKRQAGRKAVMLMAFLIVVLIAGGMGWGIYKYFYQKKSDNITTGGPPADSDSSVVKQTNADTSKAVVQSTQAGAAGGDTADFKFIFETTDNSYRAYTRYDSLKKWREPVLIDSVRGSDNNMLYNLSVKLRLSAKDTSFVKDSLQKYYARPNPVKIEQ